MPDFTLTISVSAAPAEAFRAINNVTAWWTENLNGGTHKVGEEFSVQFGDVHYSKHRLVEVVPDQKVVWLTTESSLNFTHDPAEWVGTRIVFEVEDLGDGKTRVTFTHEGLQPQIECYDACSNAWGGYIGGSLKSLIETGVGKPTPKATRIEK